ncbi:hypothetical protein LGH82_30670 [Mesorhizobium sp. PAMC28654]|uniref:hypothetical protein n=1 Tax=Mesorhizobium sp. PAMC28654 TaxID=2880934 RepID=UPI001D0B6FCC|nr:hypothetical protein [Mesorhizobium sp. PAMC28654]UDL89378.1 hypothetical protein LGH82_30670 [Mesorhizobium sp. PAMC28654]
MSAIFNKNVFLLVSLGILIVVGFWMWTAPKQPTLPTFGGSVANSLNDGIARYGAEGFREKNEQEFRDAFARFQAGGPKAPAEPKAE